MKWKKIHLLIAIYVIITKLSADPCKYFGSNPNEFSDDSDDSEVSGIIARRRCSVFGVDKCLLKIQKKSKVTDSDMLEKFIYKFIELLLIHGVDAR